MANVIFFFPFSFFHFQFHQKMVWRFKIINHNFFDIFRLSLSQVDCLVLQLHRIGDQLEKMNLQLMNELFNLLRDGFLLQEDLSSMGRLLLLEILEFRAGGWTLSENCSEILLQRSNGLRPPPIMRGKQGAMKLQSVGTKCGGFIFIFTFDEGLEIQ